MMRMVTKPWKWRMTKQKHPHDRKRRKGSSQMTTAGSKVGKEVKLWWQDGQNSNMSERCWLRDDGNQWPAKQMNQGWLWGDHCDAVGYVKEFLNNFMYLRFSEQLACAWATLSAPSTSLINRSGQAITMVKRHHNRLKLCGGRYQGAHTSNC